MHENDVLAVGDHDFAERVLSSPLPVLVDFTARWCGPCRALEPHLQALARAYAGRALVVRCDVDENPAVAAQFGVRGVPTLLAFAGGRVTGQLVGAAPRARLQDLLDRAIAPRPSAAV